MKRKVLMIVAVIAAVAVVIFAIGYVGNNFFEFFNEDPPQNSFEYDSDDDPRTITYKGKTYKDVRTLEFDINEDEWSYMGEGGYYSHFVKRYDPAYAYPNADSPIIINREGLGTYVSEDFYSYASEYNGDFKFCGIEITETDTAAKTSETITVKFDEPIGFDEIFTGEVCYSYLADQAENISYSVRFISFNDNKILRKTEGCFMYDGRLYACAYCFWGLDFDMDVVGFCIDESLLKE